MGILIGFVIGAAFAVICVLVANAKGETISLTSVEDFIEQYETARGSRVKS